MTFQYAAFGGAAANGLVGFTQASTTASQVDAFNTSGTGTAKTTGTGTGVAFVSANPPTTANQFAQVKLTTNSGSSTGIVLRGIKVNGSTSDANFTGYLVRHNGTSVAAFSVGATGTTTAVGTAYSHTRAAGTVIRATISGSTLNVYVDDMNTAVITATDTTYTQVGTTGLRVGGTNGVEVDDFYGGDLSDIGQVGTASDNTGSGGGTPAPVADRVTNEPTADGNPPWKGLIQLPNGELLSRGLPVHQLYHAFTGPAGAATLPDWLTVSTGTATLSDPATSLSRLVLDTAASSGATATLRTSQSYILGSYSRIELSITAFQFSIAAPVGKFRLGAIGNAGLAQTSDDAYVWLHSGGELKQSYGHKYSMLSPSANQRRNLKVIILPQDKEVFLVEGNNVRAYHLASRWASDSWVNAAVPLGLQVESTSATALSTRLSSIELSLWS